MSTYVDALTADRTALLEICSDLDASDWEAPSGCPGWTVKDLLTHLGSLFWAVVDPGSLPAEAAGMPTEAAQEVYVAARRSMTAGEVLEDYAAVSEKALVALEGFDGVQTTMPLGDLGSYPLSLLPAAFCFDHFTHIRADLFTPRGPLRGSPPPSDALRLVPTMDWIEAALPQQNRSHIDVLAGPADIVVTGLGGRTIRLGEADAPASASIASTTEACVRWVTRRATWDELGVRAQGDKGSLDLLRELKVF